MQSPEGLEDSPLNYLFVISEYCTRGITSFDLYIFTPLFIAVYNLERLILQTSYVINKEI